MLAEHLREAVSINTARKRIYTELSDGKSRFLSNRLIFFERLLILPAMFFDWRAKRFNKVGIPIMQNDFVSMDQLPKPETAPKFIDILSKYAFKKLINRFNAFNEKLKQEIKLANFETVLSEGKKLLEEIIELENEFRCNLAMVKHVIESLNLISANGILYAEKSKGKTSKITKIMIKGHAFMLKPSLKTIDLPAQKLHNIGCGIIVNDMPEMPLAVL